MQRKSRVFSAFLTFLTVAPGIALAQAIPPAVPGGGIVLPSAQQAFGSAVTETVSAAPLKLSLDDAIQRGLKANLAILERETAGRTASASRMQFLTALRPTLRGEISENLQQNNLATFGFRFGGFPQIIGPFGYTDMRAIGQMNLYDRVSRKNLAVADQQIRAVQLSAQDARDLVVEAVANAYLTIIADGARVEAAHSEAETAKVLFENARDRHSAGVSPAIDELRAQVGWKSRQQRELAEKNRLEKDKLVLARAIGVPGGQGIELTDNAPYSPLEGMSAEEVVKRARDGRADLKSARAQLQAAELSRQAVLARRYPTLSVGANYGVNGVNMAQSHGTFGVAGALKFDIYDGGRMQGELAQTDAVIQQRKNEIADLEGRIEQEVRSALLDLQSAADQVSVAQSNREVANQTLTQARDRFNAGVTDNIEVVQAQDALANAEESLISSLYAHNLAKVALARSIGAAEANLKQFMKSASATK
ncbi:MAG: TolC family protein [Bryobacteraceae bacterium]